MCVLIHPDILLPLFYLTTQKLPALELDRSIMSLKVSSTCLSDCSRKHSFRLAMYLLFQGMVIDPLWVSFKKK